MMPIGVPRVPYRTPKEGSWQWVDIWNCLYRERIIFLSKAVDDELGNQLVATMLYLDSENKKDMNLYINCSGGEVRRTHIPPLHPTPRQLPPGEGAPHHLRQCPVSSSPCMCSQRGPAVPRCPLPGEVGASPVKSGPAVVSSW